MPVITFTNEENKKNLAKMVLSWLKADFIAKGKPQKHFWYNEPIITNSFEKCDALVALDGNTLVGYMIWSNYGAAAEIDIVEVKKEYQRQGVFKKMLAAFSEKFPDVSVLTASVIEQSREKFTKAKWKSTHGENNSVKFYKIIKSGLEAFNTLQDGCVVAVCTEDFYAVQKNRALGEKTTKYFRIQLDQDKKLRQPIITDYPLMGEFREYSGYVGIYLNRKLIAEGKAKHLFSGNVCHANLLTLDKVIPRDPNRLAQFIIQAQQENSFLSKSNNNAITLNTEEEPSAKRKREDEISETNAKEDADGKLVAPQTKRTKKSETPGKTKFFTTFKEEESNNNNSNIQSLTSNQKTNPTTTSLVHK